MTQTTNNEQPKTSGASRRKPLPFAWTLFTAVWLLFPIGFVIQALRTDLSPVQVLAFLVSMAAFVAVFVWLMLRYPFPDTGLTLWELRWRIGLLTILAALALYFELVYSGGAPGDAPYRFMYVVIAAAVVLPTRHAAWAVAAVTVFAGAVYGVRSGWDAVAANWGNLIPFALIGIGMILVSRLVITVRELQAAREEISRLAVAEERLRFARDLHDLLGHSLSQITLKSELAGRLMPAIPEAKRAAKEIRDIEGVARKSLSEVREAVAGYRLPTLDGELTGAREMLESADIACRIEGKTGVLPGTTEAVLAWVVREGVTNVIRHSRASRCEIRLTRSNGEVHAEISDDGLGSKPEHDGVSTGSGLSGLTERIARNGGDLEAGPLLEGGFRLRASLPLRDPEASAAETASGAGEQR